MVSLVDRATKFVPVQRAGRKTAEAVGNAVTGLLHAHCGAVRTITAASGKEFAERARVSKALDATSLVSTARRGWSRLSRECQEGCPHHESTLPDMDSGSGLSACALNRV